MRTIQFGCDLDALGLTTRERRRALPQFKVRKPDIRKCLQPIVNRGDILEKFHRFLDGHFQYIVNALFFVLHLERLFHKPLAVAHIAGDIHSG